MNHILNSGELDEESQQWVIDRVEEVKSIYYAGIRDMVTHFDAQNFNDNELLLAWELLRDDPKIRTAYKLSKKPKIDFTVE